MAGGSNNIADLLAPEAADCRLPIATREAAGFWLLSKLKAANSYLERRLHRITLTCAVLTIGIWQMAFGFWLRKQLTANS